MEKDRILKNFIASYPLDRRLAEVDILGSIVHVEMLRKKRIIPAPQATKIIRALRQLFQEVRKGRSWPAAEDIHYAIEKELIRRIGPVAGKMPTARSRNDQVALDLRLYLRQELREIIRLVENVGRVLIRRAEKSRQVILPGYTHLQAAQPITLAHLLLGYADELLRDQQRLINCYIGVNQECPLGSAALAGTSFPIDRQYVSRRLGFSRPSFNALSSVSDRDFAAEFLAVVAILGMHLSRMAEDLIIYNSREFAFISLPDDLTSGSSIMPQKKNPDWLELVRGKVGRLYGNLLDLLTVLKGLPHSYNRDLQEDKKAVFDSTDTIKAMLIVMAETFNRMKLNRQRMAECLPPDILATDFADELARRGRPFRQAHHLVQKNLASGLVAKKSVTDRAFRLAVARRRSFGGTSPLASKKIIKIFRSFWR